MNKMAYSQEFIGTSLRKSDKILARRKNNPYMMQERINTADGGPDEVGTKTATISIQ